VSHLGHLLLKPKQLVDEQGAARRSFFTPALVALLPTPAPPPIGDMRQCGGCDFTFLKEKKLAEQSDVGCSR
jgi:hypothetical protein